MTIQIRLSLLFAAVVELLLGAVFWIFYLTVSADRERDYFDKLEAQALTVADVFFNADELDKTALGEAKKRFRGVLASSQVIILDSLDRCIYINDSAFAERSSLFQPIILDSTLYSFISHKAIANARKRTIPRLTEQTQQSVYLLHPEENNNYLIIIRARDEAGMNLLADTRFVLLVAAACVPFVAFGIGLWFARNALAPVSAMTKAANAVSWEQLGTRLPEGNGKDEISFLAQAFNRMFVRLESSYQAQRQFIDHASHELRTPLTIMEGEISLALLHERPVEVYRGTLSSLQLTVQRLSRLTGHLLLLAKIEAGTKTHSLKPILLDEIIFHAIDAVQTRYPSRSIITPPDEVLSNIEVRCNRELLETAFINVLDNALKFSPPDKNVEMNVTLINETVQCHIRDEGVGIHQQDILHIFTPFYRASETSFIAGTGIGLALVKAIIEIHKGSISIRSTPQKGTELTLILPRTESVDSSSLVSNRQ
jgi:signal transduction histidine kinase